jgi:hypothetical protein
VQKECVLWISAIGSGASAPRNVQRCNVLVPFNVKLMTIVELKGSQRPIARQKSISKCVLLTLQEIADNGKASADAPCSGKTYTCLTPLVHRFQLAMATTKEKHIGN